MISNLIAGDRVICQQWQRQSKGGPQQMRSMLVVDYYSRRKSCSSMASGAGNRHMGRSDIQIVVEVGRGRGTMGLIGLHYTCK